MPGTPHSELVARAKPNLDKVVVDLTDRPARARTQLRVPKA